MENLWDESLSIPFWGKEKQLQKLTELAGHCVKVLAKSDNPREMILETWLVLDYAVRDLIVSGFGLDRFCLDEFDLRYELLPEFRKLLSLLKNTASHQSGLGPRSSASHDYPPYIYSSYGFLRYLRGNYEDVAAKLREIEKEFLEKQHPELAEQISHGTQFFFSAKEEEVERLPSGG